MHCCPLIFILLLITNSVLLCAEGSKIVCTEEKKPSDSDFKLCNITAALQLIKPCATSGVGYGNAGYFRAEGVQFKVTCQAKFNRWLVSQFCVGATFISDSSGYKSSRQSTEHKQITTHSLSSQSHIQFFRMGNQPVHSGDAYYLVGNETMTLVSPCQMDLLLCYIITGNKSSSRKDFKSQQLVGKLSNTPGCTALEWEVSEKLFTDLYQDQHTALNIIGCEDNHNNKQLEIYIKLLVDPVLVTTQSSLQCHLDIKDKTVVSSAEAVATGRCVCRFSLAACNPQVSVRQYEHEFQCKTTNMTIPEMSVATNTTGANTLMPESKETRQKWTSNKEDVKVTEGHDGTVKDSSWGLTWLWISIAGVMLLATTALVVVIVCQKKPNDVTKDKKDEPTKPPSSRKIILDESLFKNRTATLDEGTSSSSHSPILNLVSMEELG